MPGENAAGKESVIKKELHVTRLKLRLGITLAIVFVMLYTFMWFVLTRFTDSPVPIRDSFITSLSIIATWMLARKIYEHWYLWIVVNFVSGRSLFNARAHSDIHSLYCLWDYVVCRAYRMEENNTSSSDPFSQERGQ